MKVFGIPLVRFLVRSIAFFILLVNISCNSPKTQGKESPFGNFGQMISEIDGLSINRDAIKVIDSLYGTLSNPTIEDLCNTYLLKNYYYRDDNIKEELYADSVLWIIRKKGLENDLPLIYGKAYLYKGDALMRQKNFNNAYRCYYEGVKAVQQAHDSTEFEDFNHALGMICYQKSDYAHAANYFKKCIVNGYTYKKDNSEDYIKFQFQQANIDNVGLCYDKLGMTDSAINYFDQALDCIRNNAYQFVDRKGAETFIEIATGVIYGNLGTAYVHKGAFNDAEVFFNKDININTQNGHEIRDAQLTQLKLADLYLKTSRLQEAKDALEKLKHSFDSVTPLKEAEIQWNKLESDYYNLMNQPPEAYAYLYTYITQKDSIDAANKKLASIDFNKVFDDIKQEDSFVALKKQGEMNNINSLVAIAFLTMMIGIAVFISRNNWKLKKLNEKVILQNKEMQQTLGALEQSQRENTHMMEMVAHDLRDPLGAIKNMTTFLLEDGQSIKDQKEFLSLIQTSSSALLGMITDLLATSITPAKMKKEIVDMKGLLFYCVDLLKFKANEKKQTISLKADDISLETDREKIWRVISNLITNAIKFSPENASIEIEMHKKPGTVLISVKDHGRGIPDNIKNNVFNVFSSVKGAGSSGEQSFGLGLPISQQIVEALGGKIWFESKEGEGTIFYVEFPEDMVIKQSN